MVKLIQKWVWMGWIARHRSPTLLSHVVNGVQLELRALHFASSISDSKTLKSHSAHPWLSVVYSLSSEPSILEHKTLTSQSDEHPCLSAALSVVYSFELRALLSGPCPSTPTHLCVRYGWCPRCVEESPWRLGRSEPRCQCVTLRTPEGILQWGPRVMAPSSRCCCVWEECGSGAY